MNARVKWGNGFVVWLLATALVMVCCGSAVARDIDATTGELPVFDGSILGLGVAMVPDYEGSDDYTVAPLPQVRWASSKGYYLNLFGNTLRVNIIPDKYWSFGPMYRYRLERDDDVDDERVKLLDEVDATSEVGAFASYSNERWLVLASAVTDASDGHDGSVADFALGYKFPLRKGLAALFATASYADHEYIDSYFSVSPAEAARSGLKPYVAGGSSWKDVGAGVAWQHFFDDRWGLLAMAKYSRLLADIKESPVVADAGDADQFLGGLILNYRFGDEKKAAPPVPRDSDGDGVLDDDDECPDTPRGVAVDSKGCPLDSDGDGVPDYLDKCPDTPRGVAVDARGCPLDSDGDGVPDYLDKCPDTIPNVMVDKDGCALKHTLQIEFDFDKADIRAEYSGQIAEAAAFVKRYPETEILVAGFTDSVGDEDYNRELSMRRAEALKNYMVENFGISREQLHPRGFGESRPVASNETEEGRAQNRRVEFICCVVIPEGG